MNICFVVDLVFIGKIKIDGLSEIIDFMNSNIQRCGILGIIRVLIFIQYTLFRSFNSKIEKLNGSVADQSSTAVPI